MDDLYSTPFSKAILTAVFAGILTTLICLTYDILFREATGFALSELINVSSIIFLVNLIFLAFGVIYYFCISSMKRGDWLYVAIIVLLTVYTAFKSMSVERSGNPVFNAEFRSLLVVTELIIGVVGAFGIPLLFHNGAFGRHVLSGHDDRHS